MADIKQVNQWFAMNKANSLIEWMDAMKKDQLSLLIAYLPIKRQYLLSSQCIISRRQEGINWKGIIDGTKSELIWDSLVGFDEIPQLLNPSSGWIANTNQDHSK